MTACHPDDARRALREAGARLAGADRDRAEAIHDLATWAARGLAAGLTVTEVAPTARVTRQTVYDLTARESAYGGSRPCSARLDVVEGAARAGAGNGPTSGWSLADSTTPPM